MSNRNKGKRSKGSSSGKDAYPNTGSFSEGSHAYDDYAPLPDAVVPVTSHKSLNPIAEPYVAQDISYVPNEHYTLLSGNNSEYNASPNDTFQSLTQEMRYLSMGPQQSVPRSSAPPSQIVSRYIKTRDDSTTEEKFDPRYVKGKTSSGERYYTCRNVITQMPDEDAEDFPQVFKVLWSEPVGNGGEQSVSGNQVSVREGRFGKTMSEKVRRFVIIKPMDGHCLCLPIMTYSEQGVNKKGVHAETHTIIYTDKPARFEGEWEKGLTRKPIKVKASSPRHKLDIASRLNYAKVYTVEYNVKVWFIGEVDEDSKWQLSADYNDVHPAMPYHGKEPDGAAVDVFEYARGGTLPYQGGPISSSYAEPYYPPSGSGSQQPPSSYTSTGYEGSYPDSGHIASYPSIYPELEYNSQTDANAYAPPAAKDDAPPPKPHRRDRR